MEGDIKTQRERALSGAQRKWQQRHQRNVREQGYPPLEVCQLARGEEWRSCSPVISAEVVVGQGQGERDEKERGGRRGGGGRGGRWRGVRREEDHTW